MNLNELTIFTPHFFHIVERVMIVLGTDDRQQAGLDYHGDPVLIASLLIIIPARGWENITAFILVSFLLVHYIQRSLIYPFLMRGKSRIPVSVVLMGAVFNVVNAYLICGWLFVIAPEGRYTPEWLLSPQFIIGVLIFIFGMVVNLHSDYIIRHLRKPGDTRHYIPRGGMFRYVSSANYYGEITEWFGFAILTWSLPGVIFCMWTFANLAPRANSLYEKYAREFGEEFTSLKRKRLIPFIY